MLWESIVRDALLIEGKVGMSRLHSFLTASKTQSPHTYKPVADTPDDAYQTGIRDRQQSCDGLNAPPSIGFPHRIFVPEHYESGYAYPLFVWLHSDHSSEYELDHVMHSLSVRNYAAVAIRGNRISTRSSQLYCWGSSLTDYALNEECVFEAIEQITFSMSIEPTKVFLGGFGKGATVAQWIGLRNPSDIAGVVACNGPFPSNKRALAQWKSARGLPVLAMQSSDSRRFGVDQVISTMKTAHCAGLNYRLIRFQEKPSESLACNGQAGLGVEDPEFEGSLEVEMLRAANRFMMGIVTDSDIPLVHQPSVQQASNWPE